VHGNYYGEKGEVKAFIVGGYNQIMQELNGTHGEYLSSLLKMLHVSDKDKKAVVTKILSLSKSYSSIPEFAEHVATELLKKSVPKK